MLKFFGRTMGLLELIFYNDIVIIFALLLFYCLLGLGPVYLLPFYCCGILWAL